MTFRMTIIETYNQALIGYSVDKADHFLEKAFIIDKKQKHIIKQLYDDREEVVANFTFKLVKQALSTPSFLDCFDGRRLAAYFLIDNLECDEFLFFVKEQVKFHDPSRKLCEHWGELVIYAWKVAPDQAINEGGAQCSLNDYITKQKIESGIIQDLFYFSIIYPKKYAQKFAWIVDGFLPDSIKKKFSNMFFRCLLPILWRNLESVNENVRLAASKLLLKVYPLHSEDDVINAEYMQKQNFAMETMLMDDCVAIRVEAIKKILLHLRLYWTTFPRYIIKVYLKKIVDELSLDSVDEVRATVYEGITHLLYCSQAITATQQALEILAKRGINDKAEKVRLAAFKLLNNLIGHRTLKCFNLVDMDNILLRLDFEHSNSVQIQIVKLVFKSFCPKKVEGLDYLERFKRIRYMCNVSRDASLNFHRHIYSLKLISIEHAARHIRSLLIAVKHFLKKKNESIENNLSSSEFEISKLNFNDVSTFLADVSGDEDAVDNSLNYDKKCKLFKDVFDSAIVLWMSLRFDLYTKYAKENAEIMKIMANLLQALDSQWNTPLIDSALVIASNLPKDKVGRTFQKVLNCISNAKFNEIYFNHYIEALSNWDMDKLVEIILEGLESLHKAIICNSNCRDHNIEQENVSQRDSPPTKRVKKNQRKFKTSKKKVEKTDKLDRPLVFLNILLASPSSCENLRAHFGFNLSQFCNILLKIRTVFGNCLRENSFTNCDLGLLINAYETLTLLSLTIKDNDANKDILSEEDENEDVDATLVNKSITNILRSEFTTYDRLFLNEIKWYENIAQKTPMPNNVLKMFLRCANLHLDCSHLSARVLLRLSNIIFKLTAAVDLDVVGVELQQCVKHLIKALEYCDDQQLTKDLLLTLKPMVQNNGKNEFF